MYNLNFIVTGGITFNVVIKGSFAPSTVDVRMYNNGIPGRKAQLILMNC